MKFIVFCMAALFCVAFSGPSFAGSHARSNSHSNSTSQAGSNVNINNKAYRPVPTAIAPGLASSGLSCNGSTSAGISGSGFGISFGATTKDKDCNTRENAKYVLLIAEDRPAAKEVLCDIGQVARAFAAVGRPCLVTQAASRGTFGNSYNHRRAQPVHYRVVRKFNSMSECRRYARHHSGVSCRPSS